MVESPAEKVLAKNGFDVKAADFDKDAALRWAAEYGYQDAVELLVDRKANVASKSGDGDTALHLAAQFGEKDVAQFLLRKGAYIEEKNDKGCTVLAWAAEWGKGEVVRLLLDKKANIEAKDKSARTPLHSAALFQHEAVVRLLVERGADKEARGKDGRTPLAIVAKVGKADMVRLLIELGADLEAIDDVSCTPLLLAAEWGHEEAARILMDKKADTKAKDSEGWTALHYAARYEHAAVVKLLLQAYVSAEEKDKKGRTALHLAAEWGVKDVVRLLLERWVDITIADKDGWTALHYAARYGHPAVVSQLQKRHANVDAKTKKGRTALMLAQDQSHVAVVKLLEEKKKKSSYTYRTAYASSDEDSSNDGAVSSKQQTTLPGRKRSKPVSISSELYNYKPLSSATSSRLIKLSPGKDDVLSFDFREVDINNAPSYEALSYEWGAKSGTLAVQCGGRQLLVTPNLMAAMKSLRLKSNTRLLWIDALCIDQQNIPERNQQVALMANIYRNAASVLIWIGDETRGTAAAFDSFLSLWNDMDSDDSDSLLGGSTVAEELVSWDVVHNIVENKKAVEGLNDLFARPYFTRAWIVQELILSKRGMVVCGQQQMDWGMFRKACQVINSSRKAQDKLIALSTSAFWNIMSTQSIFADHGYVGFGLAVSTLLRSKATDDRDKIYAALGLTKPSKKLPITPNYDLTVQEVYTEAARYLIETDQNLHCWKDCNRPSEKTISHLPSWVPDWTHELSAHGFYGHEAKDQLIAGKPNTTATSLHVDGYIIDRIRYKNSVISKQDQYEVVKSTVQALATLGRGIFDPYPKDFDGKGVSNLEALRRTLTWGHYYRDADAAAEEMGRAAAFLAWKLSTDAAIPKQKPTDSELKQKIKEWAMKSKKGGDFDYDIRSEMTSANTYYDLDLFYTERGYFGVTFMGEAQEDMVIAILGGAAQLCILRERREGGEHWYEVVADAFMNHTQGKFKKLEEIEEDAVVERLEIR
jgi:ankyrin repeat protein